MKFGQIIKHNKIFFYENHSQNEAGTLVPDLFLLFRKALMRQRQVVSSLVSIYCDSPQPDIQQKEAALNLMKYWFQDMLHFDFSEKGLGLVFHHILCIFRPNFSDWLLLLFEILVNMIIAIVC